MIAREQIIAAAKEAGFAHAPPEFKHWRGTISDLERFYAIAFEAGRVAEMEEIAEWYDQKGWMIDIEDMADAIRARNTK